jgi:hypothetical protein
LTLEGMFMSKNGQSYDTYNGINEDAITWKTYETPLRQNRHSMLELPISLKDADLLGSENSFNQTMEVINQFRIKFDKSKIRRNAYLSCKSNPVCSEVVSESDTEILQYLYKQAYS